MSASVHKHPSRVMVIVAFAIVYIVWGSTYYFISLAIRHIPALLMASLRFSIAGLLLMGWSAIRGEKLFTWTHVRPAIISGMLLLLIGNGAVVWVEQYLPTSLVAVLVAAAPIWFVSLDKRNWAINLSSRETIVGLVIGFVGVILLFSEKAIDVFSSGGNRMQVVALLVLIGGSISWAGGSLYSKYHSSGNSNSVNIAWQMLSAGVVFIPLSAISGEWSNFHWSQVTTESWLAVAYLVSFGSLAGYSAYVWLLQVCTAMQVSTYAYVNPVVAVILGVWLAGEKMTLLQVIGLVIILGSVALVNFAKYRKGKQLAKEEPVEMESEVA